MRKPGLTLASFAAAGAILCGCSTAPQVAGPVGPNPSASLQTSEPYGTLAVFSAKQQEDNVGYEFAYNQRTGYRVFDSDGHRIKTVFDNNQKEFRANAPVQLQLPPGRYTIKALARVGFGEWISVPVIIERGRNTEVHLNGQWRPPSDTPQNELVNSPAGFPMGWRANGM